MQIDEIKQLITPEMAQVNQTILEQLHSDVALVNQVGLYIVNSGGKRLRPMLVLLSALTCGYQGKQHVDLAAIIEFIHTATLLHDDVVDASEYRRGQETANNLFGNQASVLVGDFLYSRSFEMMVRVNQMKVMEVLSHTTNQIAEGEVLQLMNCGDPDTDVSRYYQVIEFKTAKLFSAATQLGAIIAEQPDSIEQALRHYGLQLGIAFQLVDDALDYRSSDEDIGKSIGDDLAEGKPTLPLIHVLENGTESQKAIIKNAIETADIDKLETIIEIIHATGGIERTIAEAKTAAGKAIESLNGLPDSDYKKALVGLAEYTVARTY